MNELNIISTLRFRHIHAHTIPSHPGNSQCFAPDPRRSLRRRHPPRRPRRRSTARRPGRDAVGGELPGAANAGGNGGALLSLPTEIRKLQGIVETSGAHEVQVPLMGKFMIFVAVFKGVVFDV